MPYQGGPAPSPLGHLPTPAQALDAPDWPGTGGFDTTPGAVPRSYDAARFDPPPPRREPKVEQRETAYADAPKPEAPRVVEEPKAERSSIASFFGFGGPKAEEPSEDTAADPKQPQRKGWWQRKPDA